MAFFLARRLAQALGVLLVVALFCFALFNFVGDPVNNMLGQEASIEERERLRADLGLDDPTIVQFARFLGNALSGDFGVSYRLQRPVEILIAERAPATLELVLVSALLAIGIGVPLGVFTGLNRESPIARLLLTVSLIGVSLPTFVIGIGLIHLFAVTLGWLPSFGRGDTVELGFWTTGLLTLSGLKALILPSITLCLYQLTLIMRLARAEMIGTMRADFVKFARARGLPERAVRYRHALPNTLVPVITVAGLQIGSLIAFTIVTETVFQWPGMGLLFIQAVQFADIPVMSAYLAMVALVFVTVNFLVDVLYAVVDPRLRVE